MHLTQDIQRNTADRGKSRLLIHQIHGATNHRPLFSSAPYVDQLAWYCLQRGLQAEHEGWGMTAIANVDAGLFLPPSVALSLHRDRVKTIRNIGVINPI